MSSKLTISITGLLTYICCAYFSLTVQAKTENFILKKTNYELNASEFQPKVSVHAPLMIGSFNIQTLGSKKFKNVDVIFTVEKIIHRYDLILLMELMTGDKRYMENFLRNVNLFAPNGTTYNMTLSDIHPDTKEHSALLYRTDKLRAIKTESYDDATIFYRKPFLAIFEAFTLRDMTRFGIIGHHVKPSKAVQELNGLADLYDYIKQKYKLNDVLLMGDFNADCTYVKENDWGNITLWTRSDFTWAITSNMDTTTNYRSCALDRFVYAGANMNEGVILSSAQVFNYQQEFGLTIDEVRSISDHWPIEIKIRGKGSEIAEKHLNTDICFKIKDNQPKDMNFKVNSVQTVKDFNVVKTDIGIELTNKTRDKLDLLKVVNVLSSTLPDVLSHELEEAIKYKINHGSLEDDSSFADVWDPSYQIRIFVTQKYSEALVCRTTTVN